MNKCIEQPCNAPIKVRGLCVRHYSHHAKRGTVDEVGLPRKTPTVGNPHTLSDRDTVAMTALCSVCGPVDMIHKKPVPSKPGGRWLCKGKYLKDRKAKSDLVPRGPRGPRREPWAPSEYGYVGRYYYGKDNTLIPWETVVKERDRLAAEQGNCCAICGKESPALHLDHCHDTGEIRGLLCLPCNTGLGMFGDNLESMLKVVSYLKK